MTAPEMNADFIGLLRKGDENAMARVVKEELPRVFNLCIRLCHNTVEAEDLCQDVFVRAMKGISQFNGQSKLSTWLYTVTLNTWKNKVRAEKVRHRSDHMTIDDNINEDTDHSPLQLIDPSLKPDQIVESNEITNQIYLAMDQLQPDEKSIVVLRDVHDLSYEEISAITGLNMGTVKSRLSRAREALREVWKKLQ